MLFLAKYWELFTTNHINKIYEKYLYPDDEYINIRIKNIKKQYIRYFIYERVNRIIIKFKEINLKSKMIINAKKFLFIFIYV